MVVPNESPQPTVPQLRLRPTIPSHQDKYSEPLGSQIPTRLERVIPPLSLVAESNRFGTESESGWTTFIHPDGNAYSWHNGLKIVTSSDARQINHDSIFRAARSILEELARARNADIQNAEAFLSVAAIQGNIVDVEYYLVDHDKCVPFWLQPVDVDRELLGIDPYESRDHLHLALKTEYWVHMESYPSHRAVSESAIDELTSLLIHNGTDDMTSRGSVSPWSVDECLRYLKLFRELHGKGPSSYRTATIARVWSTISRVRYMNRHGLPGPRLDRLQGLDAFVAGQLKHSVVLSIAEFLCFNLPKRTFYQLSELWNGRLVYIRHWDSFLDEYRGTCLRMASVSGGIICLATLLLPSKSLNNGIAAAASLSSIALFTSLYLYESHSNARLGTAMDVSAYLSRSESFRHGLRPLSILLSLPQALTIWAGLLFQIGLVQLVTPRDASSTETGGYLAWIAPFVVAILVFLTSGGSSM